MSASRHFLLFIFSLSWLSSVAQPTEGVVEWALLYYMPYDNNLSPFADSVQQMIRNAIRSPDVIATILRDDAQTTGIRHILIKQGSEQSFSVNGETSAVTSTLRHYLQWIHETVKARHYAFIFLDHGGSINELCLDEFPQAKFLAVDSVNRALLDFTSLKQKPLDLLFLQVCAKGSIEPLYELRHCASLTMASQPVLGAPNYYYHALAALASGSDGRDLANMIAEGEREDMFYSLSLINNSALDHFKIKFDRLIKELEKSIIILDPVKLKIVEYAQTSYWDIRSFLQSLELAPEYSLLRESLLNELENKVILFHKINPMDPRMSDYCGLSLLAPLKKNYDDNDLRFSFLKESPLLKLPGRLRQRTY